MHSEAEMLLDTNTNLIFVFGEGVSEMNPFFTDLLEKKPFFCQGFPIVQNMSENICK